jgi:hypothetical protein
MMKVIAPTRFLRKLAYTTGTGTPPCEGTRITGARFDSEGTARQTCWQFLSRLS